MIFTHTGNRFIIQVEKYKPDRVKCSHLSFLARKDEVKCLHSLLIIMGYFLGQHNPSNYFALTEKVPAIWRLRYFKYNR